MEDFSPPQLFPLKNPETEHAEQRNVVVAYGKILGHWLT